MYSFHHLFLWLLFLPVCAGAQQTTTTELLRSIEANNKELSADRTYMQSALLHYKSTNNLPDPEASAYFLPFGSTEAGNYTEFEIRQRLAFPSVYTNRKEWINRQEERLYSEYQQKRQDILLRAKKFALRIILLEKHRQLIETRIEQSRQVYSQVQTLHKKGEVGILELNKAKIAWIDQQFALKEIETSRQNVLEQLQALNGGLSLQVNITDYSASLTLPNADSLWSVKLQEDAQFKTMKKQAEVAAQRIEVEQSKKLPNLKLGINHQGIPGNNIFGLFGGVTLPLWNGKHKVEAARAKLEYTDRKQEAQIAMAEGNFRERMQRYEFLLEKYNKYREALEGLGSDSLLRASYQVGEISFLDYYREIQFYRNAQDRMFDMEHELHELKAIILRYQL